MSEIIKGGVPTDASVLDNWNASSVSIITNPTYSKVFQIEPNGFLNQFRYITGIVSSINVNIIYRNPDTSNITGTFVLNTASDKNVNLMLQFEPTGNEYETLALQISVQTESIKQAIFKLTNSSASRIYVASISIDCSITSGSSGSIDTTSFIQNAIMFGMDAAKPALR